MGLAADARERACRIGLHPEAAAAAVEAERSGDELAAYPEALDASWIATELRKVRNAEPAVARFGPFAGTLYAGLDLWAHALGLKLPWTLGHHRDSDQLLRKDLARPIAYPKPDGVVSFDVGTIGSLDELHAAIQGL